MLMVPLGNRQPLKLTFTNDCSLVRTLSSHDARRSRRKLMRQSLTLVTGSWLSRTWRRKIFHSHMTQFNAWDERIFLIVKSFHLISSDFSLSQVEDRWCQGLLPGWPNSSEAPTLFDGSPGPCPLDIVDFLLPPQNPRSCQEIEVWRWDHVLGGNRGYWAQKDCLDSILSEFSFQGNYLQQLEFNHHQTLAGVVDQRCGQEHQAQHHGEDDGMGGEGKDPGSWPCPSWQGCFRHLGNVNSWVPMAFSLSEKCLLQIRYWWVLKLHGNFFPFINERFSFLT